MKLLKRFSVVVFLSFLIVIILFTGFLVYDVGGYGKVIKKVEKECSSKGVSVSLVLAIIKTESNFDKNAVSYKGAIGLMQLTQSTANYIASLINFNKEVDLYSEDVNIELGIEYLDYLSNKFKDENAIICAYNAGETKVKEWISNSGILQKDKIEYKETINYLTKVKRRQSIYKVLIN